MDLAIRNAIIVDGSGRARYAGDVGVTDGVIAAVGIVEGSATEEIDAHGAVVAPGFIDCHTHYDAQICWDEMLSPSVYHGVTTVIAGNCGFTLAPLSGRQEDADYLLSMLSVVEGMPITSLRQAVRPDWRSFGEFLDHFDDKVAINTAFLVGHCALRRCVMGARATGHEATPDEIEAMVRLLRKSLDEGGVGFSTSTSISHSDHMGEPVPSRWANDAELMALAGAVSDAPGTWVEIVPGVGKFGEREYEMVTGLSLASQRPVNWNALFVASDWKDVNESQLEMGRYAAQRGAKVFGLCPAAPVKGYLNFRSSFVFEMIEGWKDFLRLSDEGQIAALRDPETRAKLWEGVQNPNNPTNTLRGIENYRIENAPSEANVRWQGKLLSEVGTEMGLSPFDALCTLAADEDLELTFSGPELGADEASWDMRREIWNDPNVLMGASDAGAHLDMFNTFALTTQLLGEGVRDRGIWPLEEGVRQITSVLADAFGLKGRGRIEQGAAADLVVFDPDTIGCGPIAMRDDLPGGESRLYGDSVGIHHVIVNGVPVAEGNSATGRKGGRILRSGRDTYTVALD